MPITFSEHNPKTIDEAVALIVAALDAQERAIVKSSETVEWHHSVGRKMRNEWHLWSDGPLVENARELYGVDHADDVSGLILHGLFATIKGERVDYQRVAARYIAHWAKYQKEVG